MADTAPCDAIWDFLSEVKGLQAVFLEISFPDSLQWLAEVAKHLTPRDFLAETRKLKQPVNWFVTHMKSNMPRQSLRKWLSCTSRTVSWPWGGLIIVYNATVLR